MNPIVLIQPGNHPTVVISAKEGHTAETWGTLRGLLVQACTRTIKTPPHELGTSGILAIVHSHPEWNCSAAIGSTITTWTLVE